MNLYRVLGRARVMPAWFWRWARWRLGRSEYRGHGADPAWRPDDAPSRIPTWAWERLRALARPPGRTAAGALAVRWARWGVAHEPAIHYSMGAGRDDWLAQPAGTLPLTTDCSGFATLCYRWAGLPDPNGLGYRVLGYTGTLLEHAAAAGELLTDPAHARPGDIIVIGPGTGAHAVLCVQAGDDPLVVSHGAEGGPRLQRLSVDDREPKRVCRTLP